MDTDKHGFSNEVPFTWQVSLEAFGNPTVSVFIRGLTADSRIIVGDETYIYYGGYQRGHKMARYEERQIGLIRMTRDRHVARETDLNPGRLLTRALVLHGRALKVYARIVGAMRVRLVADALPASQPLSDR